METFHLFEVADLSDATLVERELKKRNQKKGLSEKSKIAIIIPTKEPIFVKIKHKLPTSRLIYSVQLGQLSTDPPFATAPSSLTEIIVYVGWKLRFYPTYTIRFYGQICFSTPLSIG
jgi:hypothetical protein